MATQNLYVDAGLMVTANELLAKICMQIDQKYTYTCNMNCSSCDNNCKYELGKSSHYAIGWQIDLNI